MNRRWLIVTLITLSAVSATVLAACGSSTPTTELEPTPTQVPTLVETPALSTDSDVEPGGIDVALSKVTIPDQDVVARVNGEDISTTAYREELERALHSVTTQYALDWNDAENVSFLPDFQQQVLDEIIDRTLLNQLASQEGITAGPEEVEAEVAAIQADIQANPTISDWESFLAANNLSDTEIRDLIAQDLLFKGLMENHSTAEVAEQVWASHILVEDEETGQEILDRLAKGEDFADLASEFSVDPGSKDQGGDLGWFPRGMMVPAFEEAAFAMEAGETSGLVESPFGYHIILVHEKAERELDPAYSAQVQQQQFQTWFDSEYANASIDRLFDFSAVQ
jgi:foldase protein PrsA